MTKVYHVEFPEEKKGKRHWFFGSQSAIFDTFSPDEIGLTLESLWSHHDFSKAPYKNGKCVITLDYLLRKKR